MCYPRAHFPGTHNWVVCAISLCSTEDIKWSWQDKYRVVVRKMLQEYSTLTVCLPSLLQTASGTGHFQWTLASLVQISNPLLRISIMSCWKWSLSSKMSSLCRGMTNTKGPTVSSSCLEVATWSWWQSRDLSSANEILLGLYIMNRWRQVWRKSWRWFFAMDTCSQVISCY